MNCASATGQCFLGDSSGQMLSGDGYEVKDVDGDRGTFLAELRSLSTG